ncbi:MAG: DegV family protein [Dehalococcoidales bacterium]|nr:DegV family protein [Dehalococcoidales bacterium]
MADVLIMTDTVSGLSSELAGRYGIEVVPAANIVFEGKSYPDGVGITPRDAYKFLQKNPDKFGTATLNPSYLLELYREICKKHPEREFVFLTIPVKLSAANKIALIAADLLKKEHPEVNMRVLDAKTVANPQGMLAIAAAKAAKKGLTIDQVVDYVERTRPKIGGLMMLDTLKYVYRTGRYSKTAAMIANLLQIKPINRVNLDGSMEVVDKVRKRQDGYNKLIELIKKEAATDKLHFMVSHSDSPEIADEFIAILNKEFDCLSMAITEYSPIMGYASGPRCLFIGFHPELE